MSDLVPSPANGRRRIPRALFSRKLGGARGRLRSGDGHEQEGTVVRPRAGRQRARSARACPRLRPADALLGRGQAGRLFDRRIGRQWHAGVAPLQGRSRRLGAKPIGRAEHLNFPSQRSDLTAAA